MKINPVSAAGAAGKYRDLSVQSRKSGGISLGKDSVELSQTGRAFAAALKAAKAVGDVNLEKVEQLRAQIGEGSYRPDVDEVAGSILKDILGVR